MARVTGNPEVERRAKQARSRLGGFWPVSRIADHSSRIGFASDGNPVEAIFRNYCSVTVIGAEVELP